LFLNKAGKITSFPREIQIKLLVYRIGLT